jgi:hypothetical protein
MLFRLNDRNGGIIARDSQIRDLAQHPRQPHDMIVKATPKKKARAGHVKYMRAASLGRSPVTGARVFKPVAKGASISLDDVRRVVRTLKPLAVD